MLLQKLYADGLVKLNAYAVTLHVDPDSKLVILCPWPIPFHLQHEFNEIIARMERVLLNKLLALSHGLLILYLSLDQMEE